MNTVEIIYNPYRIQTRFIINNKSISPYSKLIQFINQPFVLWCNRVMELIEQELNDRFILKLTVGEAEKMMFSRFEKQSRLCDGVEYGSFAINKPAKSRLEALGNLGIGSGTALSTYIYASEPVCGIIKSQLDNSADFAQRGDGYSERINSFYSHMLYVKNGTPGFLASDGNALNIIIADSEADAARFSKQYMSASCIIIYLSERSSYVMQSGNSFTFSSAQPELLRNIIYIQYSFMVFPLMVRCTNSLDSTDVKLLCAVEPIIIADCDDSIEVGESKTLRIRVVPEGAAVPQIRLKVSNENMLTHSGISIHGAAAGNVVLEAYIEGEYVPVLSKSIHVIQRNPIVSLRLNTNNILLKPNETYKFRLSVNPANADNMSTVSYKSSDERVAAVDKGNITARGVGTCTITVYSGNISDSCTVTVKETIKQIVVPENIRMLVGSQKQLIPQIVPRDAYSKEITFRIDDPSIVQYDGESLYGSAFGETKITFSDVEGRVIAESSIIIESTLTAKRVVNVPAVIGVIISLAAVLLGLSGTSATPIAAAVGIILSIIGIINTTRLKKNIDINGNEVPHKIFGAVFGALAGAAAIVMYLFM